MDVRWTQIMNGLSYVKPESIDKESVLNTLRFDMFYDEQVLDGFYTMKVITVDEYIEFMNQLVEKEKGLIKWLEDKIKNAKEKREEYNPLIYYDLGSNFLETINKKMNQWNDNKS